MSAVGLSEKSGLRAARFLAGLQGPNFAVLFSRLGPYHFARLKAAAGVLNVTAVEFSDVDSTYAWDLVEGQAGFQRLMLFSGVPAESQSIAHIAKAVAKILNGLRPAAVAIPGWSDRCSLAALDWCVRENVPAIMLSETTVWDDVRKPWREQLKMGVVRLCESGLVGGQCHADYLAQLGMRRDRIFLGYDAVDNEYFETSAETGRKHAAETRRKHDLPERYFLASARFVEKKNLPRLIRAYGRYRDFTLERGSQPSAFTLWDLVLLGDGPLKSELCQLVSDLGLAGHVHLPGFKQYHELPAYYGTASAFVHASTIEQWGLVVNEAMASGLPVLVSQRCGCAADLVRDGKNGFTFDPVDVESLARLMLRFSTLPQAELDARGETSSQIIGSWGLERFAKGLSDAVSVAVNARPRRKRLIDRLFLKVLLMRRTG